MRAVLSTQHMKLLLSRAHWEQQQASELAAAVLRLLERALE